MWTSIPLCGLTAHFKVPDGPSRAGTMWSINLTRGDEKYGAMVKSLLADDVPKATRNDATYGWHLKDDMEHTIHIGHPVATSATAQSSTNKPWWQFW